MGGEVEKEFIVISPVVYVCVYSLLPTRDDGMGYVLTFLFLYNSYLFDENLFK